jgi:hypothetical protein
VFLIRILPTLVKAWNDAFALDAFFNELSRRAQALVGNERADFEARIHTARALAGGQEAIDRFLNWKLPPSDDAQDEDAADDGGDDDDDDVGDD